MTKTVKLPKNWRNFLGDDSNQTEPFSSLAEKIAGMQTKNKVKVTKGEYVLSK